MKGTFDAYGVRVGVRTNRASILRRLRSRLPAGWHHAKSGEAGHWLSLLAGRRSFEVHDGAVRLARMQSLERAIGFLLSELSRHVAENATRRLFVHAGVVGWRGAAILIPGRSHSGKSTLVAALVEAGAECYSDEYAVLDSRGRVHPLPLPLNLRTPAGRPRPTSPMGLGRVGTKALPVGMVLVTRYRRGARWRPRRLSPGEATLALLSHTVPARKCPKAALRILPRVAVRAVALRGTRGEARLVVESILRSATAGKGPSLEPGRTWAAS